MICAMGDGVRALRREIQERSHGNTVKSWKYMYLSISGRLSSFPSKRAGTSNMLPAITHAVRYRVAANSRQEFVADSLHVPRAHRHARLHRASAIPPGKKVGKVGDQSANVPLVSRRLRKNVPNRSLGGDLFSLADYVGLVFVFLMN